MRKTILWDYNGTILDDIQICYEAEIAMLKERHMKHDYTIEDYRDLFCFPVYDYYLKIGYTFEKETYEEVSEEFHQLYDDLFSSCSLCKGYKELMASSHKQNYRNVIISACEDTKLKNQLKQLHIEEDFDATFGASDLLAGGKIETAKRYMRENRIDPDTCMWIGDTVHDAETAEAVGVQRIILVASGHQSYEVLKETGHTVVHSLEEVTL